MSGGRDAEAVACPLCGASDSAEVYRDRTNRAVMCRGCTLVYLNPRLTDAAYREHYTHQYQISRHGIHDYDQAVRRLAEKQSYAAKVRYFDAYRVHLTERSRVLEIGSGWGTLLAVLRDRIGCSVIGLEISALAADVAERHYGLSIHRKTLDEYMRRHNESSPDTSREGPFDFIIMHHVLEHLTDPLAALESLRTLLASGGALALALPDVAAPDEPLDRFFRIEHCTYFTPYTLAAALAKTGWKAIEVTHTPNEMRIIAADIRDPRAQIPVETFSRAYSGGRVLGVIRRQRRKYRLLRTLKRAGEAVLPLGAVSRLKQIAIRGLRALRIIEV